MAAWERREQFRADPDRPLSTEPRSTLRTITPLDPDQFPPDIYDGDKFLARARQQGAMIEVGQ